MSGSSESTKRAAVTMKKRYGANYYKTIGAMGGKKSRGGGFAKDRKFASEMGKKGGSKSPGFGADIDHAREAGRKGGSKKRAIEALAVEEYILEYLEPAL